MAGFSQAILERIRAASDIVDIIGGYLPLKKAGANFTALCPFHKEKTPSFNVNPHKQIFHCFGCHKGGDVFTFVKEYENIGFVDAVRRLAERAKIPLESENNPAAQETRHLKDQLLEIHEKIAQRWQNCLLNEAAGETARNYLAKRGVSAEAIQLFRLGAAPELWDDTVNWAKSKNFDLATVEKAGLIIRKEETGNYYDRFRGRLMFPICDEQGRVIGFSGRILSGDEKTAKYVNSPETPIFTKSKIFFGLDKSKRAILDSGFAIICEGQLDLIACFMAGVQNVVAPQGTAFTDQHARILKRYVNEVVLCFDSDEAGQNAAVRSLDHLLASGLAVRVAVVPAPNDPDSFIKNFGGEKFRELISKAEGFFDYYLNRLCKQNDANSDKGRISILRAMAEAVHKTGSAVLIDTYAQKTALRLGVSSEAVRAEFKKIPTAKTIVTETETETVSSETENSQPSPNEFTFIKLLLERDDLIKWLSKNVNSDWIPSKSARSVFMRRMELDEKNTWRGIPEFVADFNDQIMQSFIGECLTRPLITNTDGSKMTRKTELPNPEMQLTDVTLKLRNQFLERQIAALAQKASQPEISDSEKIELLQKQQKLREQKRASL
ncbi:MAG TPA: DNA primase [Verrucomicrobiae bacterium]|jgi:DNA primase